MSSPIILGPGIQIGAGITLVAAPPPPENGSLVFNGSNYLSLPSNSAFDQNAGDWTVECFVYPTNNAFRVIYNQEFTGFFSLSYEASRFRAIRYGGPTNIESPASFPINNWYHVAMVYNGSVVTLYVNGISQGTPGTPPSLIASSTVTLFGALGTTFPDYNLIGSLSNFRVVKGVAVYTGSFTVPTAPLTVTQSSGTNISAITPGQTQLLLNTGSPNYFADASTNAFTVTNVGSVATSTDNPF